MRQGVLSRCALRGACVRAASSHGQAPPALSPTTEAQLRRVLRWWRHNSFLQPVGADVHAGLWNAEGVLRHVRAMPLLQAATALHAFPQRHAGEPSSSRAHSNSSSRFMRMFAVCTPLTRTTHAGAPRNTPQVRRIDAPPTAVHQLRCRAWHTSIRARKSTSSHRGGSSSNHEHKPVFACATQQ